MKKLYVLLFVAFVVQATAQTPAPTPPASDISWRHSVVASATMSQVSLKDWTQGGEDAISWTVRLDGKSVLNDTSYTWGNSYKLVYGQAKLGSGDVQKVEDMSGVLARMDKKSSRYMAAFLFQANLVLCINSVVASF